VVVLCARACWAPFWNSWFDGVREIAHSDLNIIVKIVLYFINLEQYWDPVFPRTEAWGHILVNLPRNFDRLNNNWNNFTFPNYY
jgi:hypothetical protein